MDSEQRGYRKERPLADIIPPDRRRQRAAALVASGMIAGAALFAFVEQITSPGTSPVVVHQRPTNIRSFAIGAATADITSKRAGDIASDGEPDQSFDLVVEGPVTAIVIASVDSTGRRFGTARWGTNDYDPMVSIGFVLAPPKTAWQLAVLEDGEPRNDGFGALRPLSEGTHRLRVYASDNSGNFEPGSYLRVYVIDARGAISASDPLAFTGHGPAHVRPKPVVPPSEEAPASPAFDRGSAAASLGAVDFRRCALLPGVDGSGHVTILFANDGTVSHAEVDHGGNTNTERGACVAKAFRATKVPPFAGAPVRVTKSFWLRRPPDPQAGRQD